jgi:ribose 1,5-bisphosphokinase PhnN
MSPVAMVSQTGFRVSGALVAVIGPLSVGKDILIDFPASTVIEGLCRRLSRVHFIFEIAPRELADVAKAIMSVLSTYVPVDS